MIWYFIGVYIINSTLHGYLEIRNFSSRVEKYFTRSLRSLVKYFSTLLWSRFDKAEGLGPTQPTLGEVLNVEKFTRKEFQVKLHCEALKTRSLKEYFVRNFLNSIQLFAFFNRRKLSLKEIKAW